MCKLVRMFFISSLTCIHCHCRVYNSFSFRCSSFHSISFNHLIIRTSPSNLIQVVVGKPIIATMRPFMRLSLSHLSSEMSPSFVNTSRDNGRAQSKMVACVDSQRERIATLLLPFFAPLLIFNFFLFLLLGLCLLALGRGLASKNPKSINIKPCTHIFPIDTHQPNSLTLQTCLLPNLSTKNNCVGLSLVRAWLLRSRSISSADIFMGRSKYLRV